MRLRDRKARLTWLLDAVGSRPKTKNGLFWREASIKKCNKLLKHRTIIIFRNTIPYVLKLTLPKTCCFWVFEVCCVLSVGCSAALKLGLLGLEVLGREEVPLNKPFARAKHLWLEQKCWISNG